MAELERYRRIVAKNEVVKFPERLYLASDNEVIFALVEKIEKKENIVLDFSTTIAIDIGSSIYIKAFIDHLKYEKKKYKILCSPKNKKMRQILTHIKAYDFNMKITYSDIKCWEVRTWYKNDNVNYGKVMMEEILPKVLNGKIASENFSYIASSLQEILSNCSEHAYIKNDEYKSYYLIAGEYENTYTKSNSFAFCILDRGQGFRSSLEKNGLIETIFERFKKKPDSDVLKAAINGRFASKAGGGKLAGRGTGLANVVENIKRINGQAYVYSDKGYYEVNRQEDKSRERKIHIKGSIIAMILPINEKHKNIQ